MAKNEAAAAETNEAQATEAQASMWGGFKIETGIEPPSRNSTSKYDWSLFPAPTDAADPTTWPSVFIPQIGSKTIYGSINAFRDKLQKANTPEDQIPEFTVSVSKEPKGVRVFRKK